MSRLRGIAGISYVLISSLFCVPVTVANTALADQPPGPVAPAPNAGAAKKLALLVGINNYKSEKIPKLRGAVNDVNGMKRLLVERFGFPSTSVMVLTDEQATREGILHAFREHLIARAEPGTVAVFYFSGHGSRMIDIDGDELDGWDETIVPYDSRLGDVFDIDDDLQGELFEALTEKTKFVTAIFDSGLVGFGVEEVAMRGTNSATRGLVRPVSDGTRRLRGIPIDRRQPPAQASRPKKPEALGHNYTRIFASDDGEQAYEFTEDEHPAGVLTHYFLEEAGRHDDPKANYQDVMDRVTIRIRTVQPGQRPQLDGEGVSRVIFGIESIPIPSYVLATPDRLDALLLSGRIDGLAKGAIYDIYPPGTKSFEDPARATARVALDQVKTHESRGRFLRGQVIVPASRAVERVPGIDDQPIRLRFEENGNQASIVFGEIRSRVGRLKGSSGPFRVVDPGQAADFVLRAETPSDRPNAARVIKLISRDGRQLKEIPEGTPRVAEHLLELVLNLDPRSNTEERQLKGLTEPNAVSKIHALFIGIDQYNKGSYNLRGCVNDAVSLEKALKPITESSVPLYNVKATREAILNEIDIIMKAANQDDLIVLFISGHGIVGYNDYFVVPHDFDMSRFLGTGLPFSVIADALSSKRGVKSLIVIDSCHAGQTGFNIARYGGIDVQISVMVAASPEEVAMEEVSNGKASGRFTRYLAEGFNGAADDNKDGNITIRELFDYAYIHTKKDSGGLQHPVYFGSLNQNIVLKDLGASVLKEKSKPQAEDGSYLPQGMPYSRVPGGR